MNTKELIISEIKKKGKISVGRFTDLCLYGLNGYYIKKNPIGSKNDFITAPEISQMFGEILGSFIIDYWKEKINSDFNLIELGPGTGTLISDIIRVGKINIDFINFMELSLIEKNKNLINLQKKNLENINFIDVKWFEEFTFSETKKPSIIYSNEFFDCFPVRQFYKKEYWYEKLIFYNKSQKNFSFISEKVLNDKTIDFLKKFDEVKVAEISESRNNYFNKICKLINKNKGVIITIDYGYKTPPNYLSLQTIYNHKKTHLFENLGNQDITSHVNFDELINIAYNNNLKIDLFCTQKDFLINYGLNERKENLQKNKSENVIKNLNIEYDRLTSKSGMGEIFKVLIVSCL